MTDADDDWSDGTWEGADRRQRRLGLTLTVAERLRWLEETLAWIHRVHELNGVGPYGRAARNGAPISASQKPQALAHASVVTGPDEGTW